MSEQRFAWIDHKIWALEQRLSKAEYQIEQLAGKPEEEPKPVQPRPEPLKAEAVPWQLPRVPFIDDRRKAEPPAGPPPEEPPRAVAPRAPKPSDADTEYLIGAKLLPRVGAAMVVLAVLFFVVWGFSSGWITPLMVYCGEIAFCVAFIVLGLIKRNEREEFGQILTGIGSCGLYLTFAGGHVYYGMYSGETLVMQFMGLSLANLAYSLWLSSRSFLAIGLIGGLAAAVMPVEEHNFALNAILHFAILVPAAYIAARNRWTSAGLAMWFPAMAAIAPLLLSDSVWSAKVAALYGTAMLCFAVTARERQNDATAPTLWWLSFVTALFGMGIMHQEQGAVHLTIFGAVLAALSLISEDRAKRALTQIGFVIPMVLAPMCFTAQQSTLIFSALAFLCSFAPVRSLVWLGVAELGLGIGAYLVAVFSQHVARQPEMVLILALTAAAVALTRALVKLEGKAEMYVMSCIGLLLPLWPRFIHLAVAERPQIMTAELAVTLGLVAFTWFMTGLAWKTRWQSADIAQWLGIGLAGASYTYMCNNVPASLLADSTVLVAMMASAIAVASCSFKVNGRSQQEFALVGIALVGGLFIRLSWVAANSWNVGATPSLAGCAALAILTVLTAALAARTKWTAALAMQGLWLALALAMYTITLDTEAPGQRADVGLLIGLLGASAVAALVGWYQVQQEFRDKVVILCAFITGVLGLRLFGVAMATSDWLTSLTISATAYSGLVGLLHLVKGYKPLLIPAWSFLAYGASQYVQTLDGRALPMNTEFGLLSGLLAVFALLSAVSWKAVADKATYWVIVSMIGWVAFSRWFGVGAQALELDVHWSGALTMAWIVYAFGLLFLGLGFRVREMRYMSFAVLTATSAKVLLVDLASSPPAVRVIVLLGLGLTMLGGGYWYVRGRARLQG